MANDQQQLSGDSKQATLLLRRIRHKITSTSVRVPVVWWRHLKLKLDPADVVLGTYPRSGSTWLRFTLFEILAGKPSNFDDVNSAFRGLADYKKGWPLLPRGGRLIGTHEPYQECYRRAVYLVRDVHDVALSEFEFEKYLGVGRARFDDYLDDFLNAKKRHGSWQNHVESWLDSPLARNGNLFVIRYEDLRKDSVAILAALLKFLGADVERKRIEKAVANNSVQRMREKEDQLHTKEDRISGPRRPPKGDRPDLRFVRSGKVGGWQEKLNYEQIKRIETRTAHVLLRLQYPMVTLDSDGISPLPDCSRVG